MKAQKLQRIIESVVKVCPDPSVTTSSTIIANMMIHLSFCIKTKTHSSAVNHEHHWWSKEDEPTQVRMQPAGKRRRKSEPRNAFE